MRKKPIFDHFFTNYDRMIFEVKLLKNLIEMEWDRLVAEY